VKGKHQLELTPKSVEIIVHGRFSACTDPEVRVMVKMGQSQHGFWTVLFLVCFIVSLIFFWCMFVVLDSVLSALSSVIGGGNDYIPLLSGM